jgi:hypothetical protein
MYDEQKSQMQSKEHYGRKNVMRHDATRERDKEAAVWQIAEICHEVNRAICIAVGDYTHKCWKDAEEWEKESKAKGVRFAIENPHLGPKEQHQAWMQDRIMAGWTYGVRKDSEKKTHPCLLPYENLHRTHKIKDYVFLAIVRNLTK